MNALDADDALCRPHNIRHALYICTTYICIWCVCSLFDTFRSPWKCCTAREHKYYVIARALCECGEAFVESIMEMEVTLRVVDHDANVWLSCVCLCALCAFSKIQTVHIHIVIESLNPPTNNNLCLCVCLGVRAHLQCATWCTYTNTHTAAQRGICVCV